MSGIKKMLSEASDNLKDTIDEELELDKAKKTAAESDKASNIKKPQNTSSNKSKQKSSSEKKGGRPTNEEKGITSRKQYTLTLKENTYKLILDSARAEDLSFAKYMERAALEYIDRHK